MRLSPLDWLTAARKQLEVGGPSAIKIEALARDLGVSKGSFYWHFKDRTDLLWQLLSYWERGTDELIRLSSEESTPQDCLRRLFEELEKIGVTGESGIFSWAKQDEEVEARVHAVEQKRLAYLCELFQQAGFVEEESRRRAEISYMAFLGYVYRGESATLPKFQRLGEDLLLLLMSPSSSIDGAGSSAPKKRRKPRT
ncbi:MAG: TetR/AcrR family transcriptional regulator [Myxococcales bacterium]|nr:TetR/AcrR family transcriptional regulator [Myxococcales bacterium]